MALPLMKNEKEDTRRGDEMYVISHSNIIMNITLLFDKLVSLTILLSQAPGVFVFGELLDMANIQDLENSPNAKYLNLLNLFAYGKHCRFAEV